MRLTNAMRDSFVDAVMADVPKVDYRDLVEKLVRKEGESHLPEVVRKALKDPVLSQYIEQKYIYVPEGYGRVYGHMPAEWSLKPRALETIESYKALGVEQDKKRKEIRNNIHAIACSCSTVEKLRQKLPEFAKYIPKPPKPQIKELPMITTLVADLSKMGWPASAQTA